MYPHSSTYMFFCQIPILTNWYCVDTILSMYDMVSKSISIEYLERPVTSDEKEIAQILEKIVTAHKTKNVPLLASVLSDDSLIMLPTDRSRFFTKNDYLRAVPKITNNLRKLSYTNVIIRIIKKNSALISCAGRAFLKSKTTPIINQRYFKCEKQGDKWLITEFGFC